MIKTNEMKKEKSVEKTFNELSKLCKHILKLSKINTPNLWKSYGKPHIAIFIGDNIKNNHHLFNLEWTSKNGKEVVTTAFYYKDASKSIAQFKREWEMRDKHYHVIPRTGQCEQ